MDRRASDPHSVRMRYTKQCLPLVLVVCGLLFAEENSPARLHDAFVMEQQGQFAKSIAIATSVIGSDQLNAVDRARAWIILGSCYHQEGMFTQAQAAFEQSLRILGSSREYANDYATALDHYAELYNNVGQLEAAANMWRKALGIQNELGDHAGATRTMVNLAGLALSQKRVHEAQEYLKAASRERQSAPDLVEDDFAVFYETEGWLASVERRPEQAIAAYQRALDISKRARGEEHWLIGWEFLLRGTAYAQAGNRSQALADMRKGLTILDHSLGRQNLRYWLAQAAYAQVLDQIGAHSEAAQLRSAAEQALEDFYRGQCVGCTINVAAFR